jgi:hypothetical protein
LNPEVQSIPHRQSKGWYTQIWRYRSAGKIIHVWLLVAHLLEAQLTGSYQNLTFQGLAPRMLRARTMEHSCWAFFAEPSLELNQSTETTELVTYRYYVLVLPLLRSLEGFLVCGWEI